MTDFSRKPRPRRITDEDEAQEIAEAREWERNAPTEPEPPATLPGGRFYPWDEGELGRIGP